MSIEVIEDNTEKIIALIHDKVESALELIGAQAAKYASDASPYDTGNLSRSFGHEVNDNYVQVGTDVEYAVYQELGTHKIKPHHMLLNAAHNHKDEYARMLERALKG